MACVHSTVTSNLSPPSLLSLPKESIDWISKNVSWFRIPPLTPGPLSTHFAGSMEAGETSMVSGDPTTGTPPSFTSTKAIPLGVDTNSTWYRGWTSWSFHKIVISESNKRLVVVPSGTETSTV